MHSKIRIQNIFHMLSYAFRALRRKSYENLAVEDFDNINDLLTSILTKGLKDLIKSGLGKNYILMTEDISTVRGKISMPAIARKVGRANRTLTCEFDEFSENILMNRIIKTAGISLLRSSVKPELKRDLKGVLMYLNGLDSIDPKMIRWDTVRYNKNNANYEMLINISRMVLEKTLLTENAGQTLLSTFEDDQKMSSLYERFVLEYFRKHYPMLHASSRHVDWNTESPLAYLPTMKTDISLRYKGKTLIIDTKYYGNILSEYRGFRGLHSANLYQVYSYMKNEDHEKAGCVDGMLLYAKTIHETVPDLDYNMDGNILSIRTLDLNTDFSEIKKRLNGIVENWLPEFKMKSGAADGN